MNKNFVPEIGFEFEYFIKKNNSEDIEFPSKLHLSTDEFPLIAELRTIHSSSYGKVYGDFIEKWRKINAITGQKGYTILYGGVDVSPELYKKALKTLGHKDITESYNIYGYDINDYSAIRTDELGKITQAIITAGLHIHFSASVSIDTRSETISKRNGILERTEQKHVEMFYLKNEFLMKEMIKGLDDRFFSMYVEKESKYRQKGFYEPKDYGFEYRSLPANEQTLADLPFILEISLEMFSNLYKV